MVKNIILKVLQKMMTDKSYSFYIDLERNGRGFRWASNRKEPFILHWDNVLNLTSHDIFSIPLEWLVALWGLTYKVLVKTTNSLFFKYRVYFPYPPKMHFLYSYKKCRVFWPNWEVINLYKGVLTLFTDSVCTIIAIN